MNTHHATHLTASRWYYSTGNPVLVLGETPVDGTPILHLDMNQKQEHQLLLNTTKSSMPTITIIIIIPLEPTQEANAHTLLTEPIVCAVVACAQKSC